MFLVYKSKNSNWNVEPTFLACITHIIASGTFWTTIKWLVVRRRWLRFAIRNRVLRVQIVERRLSGKRWRIDAAGRMIWRWNGREFVFRTAMWRLSWAHFEFLKKLEWYSEDKILLSPRTPKIWEIGYKMHWKIFLTYVWLQVKFQENYNSTQVINSRPRTIHF